MLRRLLRYAEKVLDLSSEVLDRVTDARPQPRTPTTLVLKSALAMFWARLGSLNALETVSTARFWERWLGGAMTSADTMGRVHAAVNAGQLRNGIHYVYSRLKRNKALPLNLGLDVAVLDGHEQQCQLPPPLFGMPPAHRENRTGRAHSVLPPASYAHAPARTWRRPPAPASFVGLRTDASGRR
jgi:hypothetical protein